MQSQPARCTYRSWRELREAVTTRSTERQSVLSDLPNELITLTCPVLSTEEVTTGPLFKGVGSSKTTIHLITLIFHLCRLFFPPTAPFPQRTTPAWMIYRNFWFGLGLRWPHCFRGPGCFLSIFILKDEQTHRREKNNKGRKQKQSKKE